MSNASDFLRRMCPVQAAGFEPLGGRGLARMASSNFRYLRTVFREMSSSLTISRSQEVLTTQIHAPNYRAGAKRIQQATDRA